MENAKKYLVAGYITTIFSVGFLSYLSHINSEYFLISSLIFICIISFFFFYGMNLLKEKKELIILDEKKDDLEEDFIEELVTQSSLMSKNIFKNKINIKTKNQNFQTIADNINQTANNLSSSFDEMLQFFEKYQKNDFTAEIKNNKSEELQTLIEAINKLNVKISRMLLLLP